MIMTTSSQNQILAQIDRRTKPRIDCNYSAQVRGSTEQGQRFAQPAVVANLSAAGLYLLSPRRVEQGAGLFVLVRLADQPRASERFLSIAAHGVVVRSVSESDGRFGVALKFSHYRLL